MRAAVYHGPGDVRLEDVPERAPRAGEVKVRVAYNGLCGTDVHEVFDGARAIPVTAPHPLTGAVAPVILGHEVAGVVVEMGAGVTNVVEGDLVAIEPTVSCGVCRWCASGDRNLCEVLAFHGLSTGDGGLAEYTTVRAHMLHRVPAGTDPRAAALVEPLAVCHRAVTRSCARDEDTVVVHGGGPIGIGILLMLRGAGRQCILVEPSAVRRSVAASFGATTIDPTDDGAEVATAVRDLTAGRGAHISFDAAGGSNTFQAAVSTTTAHGTVVVVASPRHPESTPVLSDLVAREIDVRTSYGYCGDFPSVIDEIDNGTFPLEGWVTTRPLVDVGAALDALRAGELIKVLIDPTA
jgi:(R,R)-butanediol dehydrogenase / meso-butanediol dehydrogenase / diacetyl reductase